MNLTREHEIHMPKETLLTNIATEIKACRKCDLWKQRRNAVPGEGSLNAPVMFIGEAPGYYEDVNGRPFVGAAGKLLDNLLSDIGFSRKEVFIGNVLKCRPPENRDPQDREIKTCTPYLDQQIRIIKPEIIVTLGRHSTSYIFSKVGLKTEGITKLRGKVYETNLFGFQISLIPMYHPAAALYNMGYKDELERDFQLLKSELGKTHTTVNISHNFISRRTSSMLPYVLEGISFNKLPILTWRPSSNSTTLQPNRLKSRLLTIGKRVLSIAFLTDSKPTAPVKVGNLPFSR